MKFKDFSDKQIASALKVCAQPKGHRCSECPIFGNGYDARECHNLLMKRASEIFEKTICEGDTSMTAYEYNQLQDMLTQIQNKKPEYLSSKYQEGYETAILKMKSMIHSFYNSHKTT